MKRKPIPPSREVRVHELVHTMRWAQEPHVRSCGSVVVDTATCECEEAMVVACEVCGVPFIMFVKDHKRLCACAKGMIAAGLRP